MGTTPGLAPRAGVCAQKSSRGELLWRVLLQGLCTKGSIPLNLQIIDRVIRSLHSLEFGLARQGKGWRDHAYLCFVLFLFLFLLAHNHFKATRLPRWRDMPSEIGSKEERGHAELSLVDEEQFWTRDPCGTKRWVVLLDHHPQSLRGLVQHMMCNLVAIS